MEEAVITRGDVVRIRALLRATGNPFFKTLTSVRKNAESKEISAQANSLGGKAKHTFRGSFTTRGRSLLLNTLHFISSAVLLFLLRIPGSLIT